MTTQQKSEATKLLTEAFNEYQKSLRARAFFKLNDSALSNDVVQNTFMKTWNFLMRGGRVESMKTFLYHVLNNLIVDQYRKHKTMSLDALLESGFEPKTDEHKRLFNILDGEKAFDMIEEMPTQYREIMRMKYVEDMPLQDISESVGISKKTLAVQMHRGLKNLKLSYA